MKRLGVFVLVLALLAATIVPAFVITADSAKAAGKVAGSSVYTTGGGNAKIKRCVHVSTYTRKVITNWAQPNTRTIKIRYYCRGCGKYLRTHAYYERYISKRWTKWSGSDCWYVE